MGGQAVAARGAERIVLLGDRERGADRVQALAQKGKVVRLISRARRNTDGVRMRVRAEVLPANDLLAREAP